MQTKMLATPEPTQNTAAENPDLNDAIRRYVRAYALWHDRPQAAQRFGVSRHTLWRFLERGHLGRSLPRAVTGAVGEDPRLFMSLPCHSSHTSTSGRSDERPFVGILLGSAFSSAVRLR